MWLRRRLQVLSRDPICADGRVCGGNRLSTEVDHIVLLEDGGAPYAMDNLRGTCSDCHQPPRRTADGYAPAGGGFPMLRQMSM
jgi:5-methylcytosine-specific restriction endonuclease McrA